MNSATATVWEVIIDDESLLAGLTAIMRKGYQPFLSREQVESHRRASNSEIVAG